MKFAIYLPPQYSADSKLPVIYWLSGLTCDENNFIQKAGAQRFVNSTQNSMSINVKLNHNVDMQLSMALLLSAQTPHHEMLISTVKMILTILDLELVST